MAHVLRRNLYLCSLPTFPPIKKYKSVPDKYYVPYPDTIYSEAAYYLIETAKNVCDKRMAYMLESYLQKPGHI